MIGRGRPERLTTSIRVLVFTNKVILRVNRNFNFHALDVSVCNSTSDVTLNIDSECPGIWEAVKDKYNALLQKERDLQKEYINSLTNIVIHNIIDVDITTPISSDLLYPIHINNPTEKK